MQPLVDYQNSINAEIAEILIELKEANNQNEGYVFGFLPSKNKEYLEKYDDSQLINGFKFRVKRMMILIWLMKQLLMSTGMPV